MKRIALACTALIAMGLPARAQLAVVDGVAAGNAIRSLANDAKAAAQTVVQINNQVAQLVQLKATLAAVAHGNLAAVGDLVPQLGAMGITNPFGEDTMGTMQALSGLASAGGQLAGTLGQTGQLAQSMLSTDQFYAPRASDFRAASLLQAAQAVAYQKAVAQQAMDATTKRIALLNDLRNQLGSTSTLKGSTDAVARLTGEGVMAQTMTNQLLAVGIMQRAQETTDQQRELQAWRCSAEALLVASSGAATAASGGAVILASTGGNRNCTAPPSSGSSDLYASLNGTGTVVSASAPTGSVPDDGTTLGRMLAQPWGQQAADNATALGVNPVALAATCSLESNCRANPGGTGTISGAFQMSDGTYAQTVNEVRASNPDLAASITAKNDPASQSIAAAQYLKDGAGALQLAGIDNPSVMDVRGYYNFGPANATSLAKAPDNQLMTTALTGLSQKTLAANGINDSTTVGQWRSGVVNKIGAGAASQSVLNGARA